MGDKETDYVILHTPMVTRTGEGQNLGRTQAEHANEMDRKKNGGRHFVAEHPRSSDQWSMPEWAGISRHPKVATSVIEQ